MNEIQPFDGEGNIVTSTYVRITDYIIDTDEEAAFRNAPIANMADQGKLRLWNPQVVDNKIRNGTFRVTGHTSTEKLPVEITIHSAKRDLNIDVESFEDACRKLMSVEDKVGSMGD